MKARKFLANIWVDVVSLVIIGIVFVVAALMARPVRRTIAEAPPVS